MILSNVSYNYLLQINTKELLIEEGYNEAISLWFSLIHYIIHNYIIDKIERNLYESIAGS